MADPLADRFNRVPPAQQRYLVAGAVLGWPASTGAIAKHLGVAMSTVSPDRAGLIDEGLLYVPRRGQVDLVVPPLAGWIERNARADMLG